MTEADDVVLPWNEPIRVEWRGGKARSLLVGLSLSKRSWLRSYFAEPDLPFDYEADPLSARFPGGAGKPSDAPVIREPDGSTIPLKDLSPSATTKTADAPAASAPVAVVPANLLSYLTAARAGRAVYDASLRLFVPVPTDPVYDKARLYAKGIDDVPRVVEDLMKRRFAVMSESARIAEIQQQDHSLQLLVSIVGIGVFLFGVVVVVSVLLDSTNRKRGTIGILRVMGASSFGIFYVVLLRAIAIGILAGALSVGLGHLIALALGWHPTPGTWLSAWKPEVRLIITPETIGIVVVGALACCALGSLLPAWRASRLDPFDAIVEGRFH